MEGMLYSILAAVILAALGWIAGRFSVKTKVQVQAEEMCKRVEKLEKVMPLLLKSHLAILLALKRGKVNGECDEVLKELNDYFCELK